MWSYFSNLTSPIKIMSPVTITARTWQKNRLESLWSRKPTHMTHRVLTFLFLTMKGITPKRKDGLTKQPIQRTMNRPLTKAKKAIKQHYSSKETESWKTPSLANPSAISFAPWKMWWNKASSWWEISYTSSTQSANRQWYIGGIPWSPLDCRERISFN